MTDRLRVVIIKPSKYAPDGTVERFRWGFMPNSTLPYIRSMTPEVCQDVPLEIHTVDEYVHTDLEYLSYLNPADGVRTLVALVGVQSHQLHRALDLAAYARRNGCMAVIGGPHPMTCDTSMLQGRGISFALAEADLVWERILRDAIAGELQDSYGAARWQQELSSPVIVPPKKEDIKRYIVPMLGLYPARGCPFSCSFCSVVKIAGRRIRSQKIGTTIDSLRLAKAAGINTIMFTSDNFNKYGEAEELLEAMIAEKLGMKFFVQCDTQVARQEAFVELLSRAGCFQIFVGAESFNREVLKAANKQQNFPETYDQIVRLCNKYAISSHFSNIIGFPQDDRRGIMEHLETLRALGPTLSSFYILCPIPGTEQYADFLKNGLIEEENLDRFDTTSLTWRHEHLSKQDLSDLLFHCYRSFFSARHIKGSTARLTASRNLNKARQAEELLYQGINMGYHQYCAMRRIHPMSGGIWRVKLDRDRDYSDLRAETFGFRFAPLPQNLELGKADEAFNRQLNVTSSGGNSRTPSGRAA